MVWHLGYYLCYIGTGIQSEINVILRECICDAVPLEPATPSVCCPIALFFWQYILVQAKCGPNAGKILKSQHLLCCGKPDELYWRRMEKGSHKQNVFKHRNQVSLYFIQVPLFIRFSLQEGSILMFIDGKREVTRNMSLKQDIRFSLYTIKFSLIFLVDPSKTRRNQGRT